MKIIDESVLQDLTVGSTILGAGGGGDPYIGGLLALDAIRTYGPVTVVEQADLPDDARVAFIAGFGAPTIIIEKLLDTSQLVNAFELLQEHVGYEFTHVSAVEAGGMNAITPIPVAAKQGLPMLDADAMGRAFPHLEMITIGLYGGSATPLAFVDERGTRVILESSTNERAENVTRAVAVAVGCMGMIAFGPMTGKQAKDWLIWGVLTKAEGLGVALRDARAAKTSPVEAVLEQGEGVRLFEGKISDVSRRTERGWHFGEATVAGVGPFKGSELKLQFQNEHLAALRDGRVVATVPDLIMILEADTGEPITAEEVKFGYRVVVIGLPCDHRWRTPEGLALAGPRKFGYDMDFIPVEST